MAGPRRLTELDDELRALARPHLEPGPVAVALSGGADSAAMAGVVVGLARELGLSVRALHVDHGWPASSRLRSAAVAIAERLGIAIEVLVLDGSVRTETAGREARYRVLFEELGDDERLAVAHTADDQVETIVGNLFRGTGLAGLAGMPRRRGPIVRPLLEARRAQLREFASLAGLPWIDDPANEDPDVRRVVIRRELLPFVEGRLARRADEAVLRLGRHAEEASAWIRDRADVIGMTIGSGIGTLELRVPWTVLAVEPAPVRAEVLRRAVRTIRPPHPPTEEEVGRLLDLVAGAVRRVELAGGVEGRREGPSLVLTRGNPPMPEPIVWSVPGVVTWDAFRLEAWVEHTPPVAFPVGTWTQVFDADVVGDDLVVRTVAAGDRLPMGRGHKAALDALAEAGIGAPARPRWPLVADAAGQPLWLPGVRRASAGWVTDRTRRYLWARVARLAGRTIGDREDDEMDEVGT